MRFSEAVFVGSVFKISQLPPPTFPEIAFVGRSNVGKSSLINRLLNRKKLVAVSARPGKTQSLNFFLANGAVYLVDLPGYGYASISKAVAQKWRQLIESYLLTRETLRRVVMIIDLRHEPRELDLNLANWLRANNLPFSLVYTKLDKLSRNQQQAQARILDAAFGVTAVERVLFSAKTGEGLPHLLALLERALGAADRPADDCRA